MLRAKSRPSDFVSVREGASCDQRRVFNPCNAESQGNLVHCGVNTTAEIRYLYHW